LVDREAEIAAATDEGEPRYILFAVNSLASLMPVGARE
jgi:hypothetical protein